MIIISQYKDKITQTIEFSIKQKQTCRSVFIDKDSYEKFKKITQKKDDGYLSLKELKGIGELLGKEMTKQVYTITERTQHENFGTFSSKEKAKEVLQNIVQAHEKKVKRYEIPQDENADLVLF